MLQQRLHFRQYARAIGSASPPPLVAPLKPCTLFECIRHELLKGGEELRVVSSLPRRLQHYRAELFAESGRLLQEGGDMRAHQPGSTPIDIPETVPNPAYTPAPAPAPERAPTKVPEKVPEKVNRPGVIRGVFLSAVNAAEPIKPTFPR